MASYINSAFEVDQMDGSIPTEKVIPVNRWARCCFTFQVEDGGPLTLQGTIDQINRRDTLTGVPNPATYITLKDDLGVDISGITGPALIRTSGYALEAVRVVAEVGTGLSEGRVMQQGEAD